MAKVINYPNKKKSVNKRTISHSNRGMNLEEDLSVTNQYYLDLNLAVVYKKPTPIQIVKVDYSKRNSAKITEAYFNVSSTTDYNGIYKGKYIDFEAKETQSLTSFPLSNIHAHQIKHLDYITKHGGFAFVIIRFVKLTEDYLVEATTLMKYLNETTRKSIPYQWIQENGYLIENKYQARLDYLKIVDQLIKESL